MLKRWLDTVILLLALGIPSLNGVARAHAAHDGGSAHEVHGYGHDHGAPVHALHVHDHARNHAHSVAQLQAAHATTRPPPDDCDGCDGTCTCCCHDDCPFAHCVLALPCEGMKLSTPALLSFQLQAEPPQAPATVSALPPLRPPIA